MRDYLQILIMVFAGVALLWFGYSLLFGQFGPLRFASFGKFRRKRRWKSGKPGDPQVCPVCSTVLFKGELVSSLAYPSISGGRDRIMHIQGCYYCLEGNIPRHCPVCGNPLRQNEFLVARMFERPRRRNHVHVLGCNRCKRVGTYIK